MIRPVRPRDTPATEERVPSRLIPPPDAEDEWFELAEADRRGKVATSRGRGVVEVADKPLRREAATRTPRAPSTRQVLCGTCHAPNRASDHYCTSCGSHLAPSQPPVGERSSSQRPTSPVGRGSETAVEVQTDQGTEQTHSFHCQNCGADITTALARSYRCPFCDSTYVAEIQSTGVERRRPEFVIGFAVTREDAARKFAEWMGRGGWFRPKNLSLHAITEKQVGVYVPFWHYAYMAQSRWQAMIGQYWYRTETYTVRNAEGKMETRTRTVRETAWHPLSGEHQKYYFGYLVSASKGLPQDEAIEVQPYNLQGFVRYEPYYLAGWASEEYQIDTDEAKRLAEDEFRRREVNAIAAFLPGDTHRALEVDTRFELNETDLVLLPMHIFSYRYKDRVYRFLVNGQTGRSAGQKPLSVPKIVFAVIVALLVLLAVAAAVAVMQGG